MRKTMKSLAFLGVILGLSAVAVTSHATTTVILPKRTTFLTFNRPVALPGIALGTGTYIFELADPNGDNSIVRVSSADRQRVYLTAFTYGIQRPSNVRRDQPVIFGESSAGTPTPIKAWFPEGSDSGREFIYRK